MTATPPRVRLVQRREEGVYLRKVDRVTVRHRHGEIVAVIEIVSPGNKSSKAALRAFVEKSANLILQGVHLMLIDLFPPTKRDPRGLHQVIWDELGGDDDDFEPPGGKRLTLASYDAGPPEVAYVEQVAVGDALPEMPIFLRHGFYVPAPLEATYQTTWNVFPAAMKTLLER